MERSLVTGKPAGIPAIKFSGNPPKYIDYFLDSDRLSSHRGVSIRKTFFFP